MGFSSILKLRKKQLIEDTNKFITITSLALKGIVLSRIFMKHSGHWSDSGACILNTVLHRWSGNSRSRRAWVETALPWVIPIHHFTANMANEGTVSCDERRQGLGDSLMTRAWPVSSRHIYVEFTRSISIRFNPKVHFPWSFFQISFY